MEKGGTLSIHEYTVVKRNGTLVPFRKERIALAIEAAFRDTKKIGKETPIPEEIKKTVEHVTELVVEEALQRAMHGTILTVEKLQDLVEVKLMACGFHDVARDYISYRDRHKKLRQDSPQALKILKRDNITVVRFNPMKIASAIERGFRDTLKISGPTPPNVIDAVNEITSKVVAFAVEKAKQGAALTVEVIQDSVERELMAAGYLDVAKDYILYRSNRAMRREHPEMIVSEEVAAREKPREKEERKIAKFTVQREDGTQYTLSSKDLEQTFTLAAKGYEELISVQELAKLSLSNCYDGMKESEVHLANIMAARIKIEEEPAYTYVAAKLLLNCLYKETMGIGASDTQLEKTQRNYFKKALQRAVEKELLNPELLKFDLESLSQALEIKRDAQFSFLGLQTLYDRYFIHSEGERIETPQIFWMRVAMGLALKEGKGREKRAIEFYNVMSQFLFIPGTPTLFNSGSLHSQLSSCYLSTVMDDLTHIFKVISDDAQLSKWAGGLGNDWTNVRATGSRIKGTNGKSQGVIPFLKVANDTALAVNQGGRRKGAMCAYLETWHLDIEEFLELRKNTGDERRRTHDMNTANWIPDLFMKRVLENGTWTLFSPSDVPDLHDLYGKAFEKRYNYYEKCAEEGKIKLFKKVEAAKLWRKMLSMLYETGHPWITFKDPSNIRSPQDHVGVVHNSNLCTEILLNTSIEETAVCNLGSLNLLAHMKGQEIDRDLLASTIQTAMRMLDNVIDINFYPTGEAQAANERHRPVGLGLMGFQDVLYKLGISYASLEAVDFADKSMELISYYTLLASSALAEERGCYSSYKGSKWDRGILPIDSLELLEKERGEGFVELDKSFSLDWSIVRKAIEKHGMRNSNTIAIAPTATIANIAGITQSIEPMYKHLFVKSNLSGDFITINPWLVHKLKQLDLWNSEMVDDLKYFDGSIQEINRIPEDVKKLFLTAFEIEPEWLIECASRRQKWIDMGQSLNLYLAEPSGKKLNLMYLLAWKMGLKTTYYLRALGATHVEKSATDINIRGIQPRWMKSESPSARIKVDRCNPDESCDVCQ